MQSDDLGGAIVGVLDRTDAADQVRVLSIDFGGGFEVFLKVRRSQRVHLDRAAMLAQPDHAHLGEAAFDVATEVGVRLDTSDKHRRVGLRGIGVLIQPRTARNLTDLDGVHGGANLGANKLLGDAKLCQDTALPFGCSTAMASHRRKHERLRAHRFKLLHDRLDHDRDVGNATAASTDRDGRPRLDALQ